MNLQDIPGAGKLYSDLVTNVELLTRKNITVTVTVTVDITLSELMHVVEDVFGFSKAEIIEENRQVMRVLARQLFVFFAAHYCGYTYRMIQQFIKRDRSRVSDMMFDVKGFLSVKDELTVTYYEAIKKRLLL